jgi:dUTP pyrophosphatase
MKKEMRGALRSLLPQMLIYRLELQNGEKVPLPKYSSEEAAAMDFYSANTENVLIKPEEICIIPLGIKVAVPKNHKLTLKPRSGLAGKHGITITNSPGTVDSDYRGEVKVILQNCGGKPFVVEPFMRICQGEIEMAPQYPIEEVETLEELGVTERGEGGFNSTGTK